jgi:hypothetical protein
MPLYHPGPMCGSAESILEQSFVFGSCSRNCTSVDSQKRCLEAWIVLNNRDSRFACHLTVFIVPKAIVVYHDTVGVVCIKRPQFERQPERMPATKTARVLYLHGGSTKPRQIQIANVNTKLPFAIAIADQRNRVVSTAHLLQTGHRPFAASSRCTPTHTYQIAATVSIRIFGVDPAIPASRRIAVASAILPR